MAGPAAASHQWGESTDQQQFVCAAKWLLLPFYLPNLPIISLWPILKGILGSIIQPTKLHHEGISGPYFLVLVMGSCEFIPRFQQNGSGRDSWWVEEGSWNRQTHNVRGHFNSPGKGWWEAGPNSGSRNRTVQESGTIEIGGWHVDGERWRKVKAQPSGLRSWGIEVDCCEWGTEGGTGLGKTA